MGQTATTRYVDLIGEKKEGETQIIRSAQLHGNPPLDEYIPGMNTLLDYFKNSVKKFGNEVCIAKKKEMPSQDKTPKYSIHLMTYNQVKENAKALGKAIVKLQLTPDIPSDIEGETIKPIGVYANTREEWITLIIATWYSATTTVPLYSTLGKPGMKYIMEETQFSTIFLADELCKNFIEFYKENKIAHLTTIVLFEDKSKKFIEDCNLGLKVYTYNELIEIGLKTDIKCPKINPDSIDTICYTSGTTGVPKGVVTNHRMLVSYTTGILKIDFIAYLDHSKSYMANLPMAHVFERNIILAALFIGARICFANPYTLKDDLKLFKPNIFSMVPRMTSRLHKALLEKVESLKGMKRKLFDYALRVKMERIKKGKITHLVYDKFIFKQFREAVGNNLDFLISGAAMADGFSCNQLQALFSCRFINGYGCSETCGACTITHRDSSDMTTIGFPIVSLDAKLVDIPELNYTSKDKNPRGELCIKGKLVMPRYFKQPEKTKEMIDSNGWLHTGDVAELMPTGVLKIIDRAKNVFKLSQGEYIVPDKIENVVYKSKYVFQAFIYGDSSHYYIICVVVPDKKYSMQSGLNGKAKDMKFEDLCANADFNKEVLTDIVKLSKENGLNSLETVKKLLLSSAEMTVENDLLTPTLKLKRHNVFEAYKKEIGKIYTPEI